LDDQIEMERYQRKLDIENVALDNTEISEIVAFLGALTGRTHFPRGVPKTVPSGLPVDH